MKVKASLIVLLLALSMLAAIPIIANTTNASSLYPGYPDNPYSKIKWETGGKDAAASLAWNPEYLQLQTETDVYTNTTIHIWGTDAYGQSVEAIALIPGTHDVCVPASTWIPFIDIHSGKPVPFANITDIFQENGTHCNSFVIYTLPEPWEEFLGLYEATSGQYLPGQYPSVYGTGVEYLVWNGTKVVTQDVPVEPSNPDPVKIVINWLDYYSTLGCPPHAIDTSDSNQWTTTPMGAQYGTTLYLEGLDEHGMKLGGKAVIGVGNQIVNVATYEMPMGWVPDWSAGDYGTGAWTPVNHTFSTVCKVWGGTKDEYYIFTHPHVKQALFEYFIRIDHFTLTPDAWDILANPNTTDDAGNYLGVTNITLALRDEDGNLVHAPGYMKFVSGKLVNVWPPIIVNFYTSGGKIQPSLTEIEWCHITAVANLTADTNARTINVTADINIPACPQAVIGAIPSPEMNLQGFVELTFDGVNSVGPQRTDAPAWPIHNLECGYTTYGQDCHWKVFSGTGLTAGAPFPDPVLPEYLGGPTAKGIKLDGPIYEVSIPLWVGCNLISSPVIPMFGPHQYDDEKGIPMDYLFGNTSATTCIEAIWWYGYNKTAKAMQWYTYVPGFSDPTAYFVDGVGYWIKAFKPCTLEISGVLMENAPFIPREYNLTYSWNLMGFTYIDKMTPNDYLESALGVAFLPSESGTSTACAPVWVYDAQYRTWIRDPDYLWPTHGFWVNYKYVDISP